MVKDRIFAAIKKTVSNLVFTNITVVDVFSQELFIADVAVSGGYIVGVGDYRGCGNKEVDGTGRYMVPGLIDAHAHIESTLVTPVEYGNAALARGITGVVADPHEIANVAGVEGIRFMIENSRLSPMDFYFMLPSCVPATAFENSGSVLRAADLAPLYAEPEVNGLAEVMDFPAVLEGDPDMLQKLADAEKAGYRIDGHGAGFTIDQLNGYGTAHIRTDHECDTASGLVDRVRRGIYTLVREGTVCKDLKKMLPAITERNAPMLCFATDDKHLDEILDEGGVDANVRLAIAGGLPPATAIQIGSLNVARCYNIKDLGAIAPGYIADFAIVDDIERFTVSQVYKKGRLVAENGRLLAPVDTGASKVPATLTTSVAIGPVSVKDLAINMKGCSRANIIEVVPGSIVTNHLVEEVRLDHDRFVIDPARDQLKVAVVERHKKRGNIGVGIVKGFAMRQGAIATTIAHDSHNLIVAGTSDEEMVFAVKELARQQGGIVAVDGGRVLACLKLEIAGLITARQATKVVADLEQLRRAAAELAPGCSFNPFLALSFLSLVVIPQLKISDSGLFDFGTFRFVEVPV